MVIELVPECVQFCDAVRDELRRLICIRLYFFPALNRAINVDHSKFRLQRVKVYRADKMSSSLHTQVDWIPADFLVAVEVLRNEVFGDQTRHDAGDRTLVEPCHL